MSIESLDLRSNGIVFHSFGATTAKALTLSLRVVPVYAGNMLSVTTKPLLHDIFHSRVSSHGKFHKLTVFFFPSSNYNTYNFSMSSTMRSLVLIHVSRRLATSRVFVIAAKIMANRELNRNIKKKRFHEYSVTTIFLSVLLCL